MHLWGPVPGRSRRGRLGGTGLSSRGGSLQGLFLRQNSSLRGRRSSPRFSSPAECLTSGGVGDALLPIDVPTICHMGVAVHKYRAAIRRIFKRGADFFSSVSSRKHHNPSRPQEKFPGAGPRAYRIVQYRMHCWGPAPGKVSPGEAWRDRPLRKASPGGAGRANPKQIFRQASKPPTAIVTPYCNKLRL